jgi:hypothetical protein
MEIKDVLQLLLPQVILEYFEILQFTRDGDEIYYVLEEKNESCCGISRLIILPLYIRFAQLSADQWINC